MTTTAQKSRASGEFQVTITPQGGENKAEGSSLGRMSINKQFHGDIEGTSHGDMLTGLSELPGSGAYVAVERVVGTVHGREGAFVLYHVGIMTRGTPQLSVTVVPDSGSGELAGIEGEMKIDISGGKHFYEFEYSLPGQAG